MDLSQCPFKASCKRSGKRNHESSLFTGLGWLIHSAFSRFPVQYDPDMKYCLCWGSLLMKTGKGHYIIPPIWSFTSYCTLGTRYGERVSCYEQLYIIHIDLVLQRGSHAPPSSELDRYTYDNIKTVSKVQECWLSLLRIEFFLYILCQWSALCLSYFV